MSASALGFRGKRRSQLIGLRSRLASFAPLVPVLIAVVWLIAATATVIWAWGLSPVVFATPDEAVVRFAAKLIAEHGNPILKLPFVDTEDLAHPRTWLAFGDTALPTYAPVALYGYGFILRLHTFGLVLIALLPGAACAAFAAGTAWLLPVGRRWLAVFAPALGFSSLYWLMRPWVNLSPLLGCLCWAFFFWSLWYRGAKKYWLVAAALCVGAAAAIRPDYAGFLILCALFLMVAAQPSQWKLVLALLCVAGVTALVPNLILNKLATGHAFRAVYQLALDRQYGADGSHGLDSGHGLPGFGALRVLLAPMGLPPFQSGMHQLKKYFLGMGPAPWLLLGQLALIPLLRKKPAVSRVLYLAAILLVAFFAFSRAHEQLFGGSERAGFVHHSVARYAAPVFLFAALPPLLFLGNCRKKIVLALGSALVAAVAASSIFEIYRHQPSSLSMLHDWDQRSERLLDALATEIPPDAIVYSLQSDKLLWSRWRVGLLDEPDATATSLNRAVDTGLPVFVLDPGSRLRRLTAELAKSGIALARVDARRRLYRATRRAPPPPQ